MSSSISLGRTNATLIAAINAAIPFLGLGNFMSQWHLSGDWGAPPVDSLNRYISGKTDTGKSLQINARICEKGDGDAITQIELCVSIVFDRTESLLWKIDETGVNIIYLATD